MKKQKKSIKFAGTLSLRTALILFALLPLLVASVVLSCITISTSSKQLKSSTHNSMVAIIDELGAGFDQTIVDNETKMKSFIQSPIVRDYLKNPDDATLASRAEQYTLDYFGTLEGWEGIYLADWNSQVMTHPAEPVIGRVMREGDSLEQLRNDMLSAEGGVLNYGIITSPASGELIISMYVPIFDEDGTTPIGYAGGGTFVNSIAPVFADVSNLGLSTAYVYIVDSEGTMLYHPNPEKIGNPVENAAVKGVVADLQAGKQLTSECIEYEYKGAQKYAAYHVGRDATYIAILTADESEALSSVTTVAYTVIVIGVICVILFAIVAILIAKLICKPLEQIADSVHVLSTGNLLANCEAKSHIKETCSLIASYDTLKSALVDSISKVKSSASMLNTSIVNVDSMSSSNFDSVSQIDNAINEVASTSQVVAESAQTMATKANDLGDNIESLNANVEELYNASNTIKDANNEATKCMKAVYEGSNESVDAMATIAEKIAETNKAIEDINTAVQAIENIASQTNLLSLNASIEAARAGEAGRGFAVVAEEIRNLADSSGQSAKEIRQIIENVVELSNVTVEVSQKVSDIINQEQIDIETTQEKFNTLSISVESSIDEINTIKNMTTVLDEIKADFVNTITELGAVSEELGASAEEVAATCQNVTAACNDTKNQTSEMNNINSEMSDAIAFFKTKE